MSRILITGGSGFVGQALCPRLIEAGHHVTISTRNKTHTPITDALEYCQVGSLGPDTDWTEALSGIDLVIHLAARVHIMNDTASDPETEFQKTNSEATRNLAEQAAKVGVKQFIFLSTIKVNGEETDITSFKSTDIPYPADAYGRSKHDAERHLKAISEESELNYTIFRPPLMYGPDVRGNFLSLLKLCDKSLPLPFENIENNRSLLFVGNLAEAILQSISATAAQNATFLISDGDDLSTPDLVRHLAQALGKPARLFPFPTGLIRLAAGLIGKSGAVNRLFGSLQVDNSAICQALDWTPPYNMVQSFKQTADWYRELSNKT